MTRVRNFCISNLVRKYDGLSLKLTLSSEPNRTKSYKLERALNKNLENFPSAMFPKLGNAIEIDLKETKSAKMFKQRVIKNYLENYERFKCEKPSCISCE